MAKWKALPGLSSSLTRKSWAKEREWAVMQAGLWTQRRVLGGKEGFWVAGNGKAGKVIAVPNKQGGWRQVQSDGLSTSRRPASAAAPSPCQHI